jgi:hypothetical protein
MFTLGIIEESLENKEVLETLKIFLFKQRIQEVPTDENPLWHINEYHVPDNEIEKFLKILTDKIKQNYYLHSFNDEFLFVVLKDKYFQISREKDVTWDAMIEYGVSVGVERHYLESVPLSV